MLTIAVILFAIAALGGLVLAFLNKRPMFLSIVHGLIAAAGLVLLIMAVLQGGTGILPGLALALFVIAALGGFVMFSFHLRGRQLPRGLMLIHGSLAVIAEVILIFAIV